MDTEASLQRVPDHENSYLQADERRANGKALRDIVPRDSRGLWRAPKDRRSPIDVLNASKLGRQPDLIPNPLRPHDAVAFAFYRGSAAIMAADLTTTAVTGIRVQACGDAHLSNFGGFATPERRVIFDINDFDETLPGPWEWDLKRHILGGCAT